MLAGATKPVLMTLYLLPYQRYDPNPPTSGPLTFPKNKIDVQYEKCTIWIPRIDDKDIELIILYRVLTCDVGHLVDNKFYQTSFVNCQSNQFQLNCFGRFHRHIYWTFLNIWKDLCVMPPSFISRHFMLDATLIIWLTSDFGTGWITNMLRVLQM